MASILDWFGYGQGSPDEVAGTVPGDAGQAAANKGGLMDMLGTGMQNNQQTLIGMGLGLMSGDSKQDAWRNAMLGAQRGVVLDTSARKDKESKDAAAKRRKAYEQLLPRYGVDPSLAEDEDAARSALLAAQREQQLRSRPDKGDVIGNAETGYYRVFDNGDKRELIPGVGKADPYAVRAAQADKYNLQGEERQRFILTGGLTDLTKPFPAELAARMGLAEQFLSESKAGRRAIEAGDATGPVDAAKGAMNMGKQGAIARHIKSGQEALIRNLTGAGKTQEEAESAAAQYSISPTDGSKTALDKYDRLVRELDTIRNKAYEGRGKPPEIQYKDKFGTFEVGAEKPKAAQAVGKGGGRTAKGVQWSIEGM